MTNNENGFPTQAQVISSFSLMQEYWWPVYRLRTRNFQVPVHAFDGMFPGPQSPILLASGISPTLCSPSTALGILHCNCRCIYSLLSLNSELHQGGDSVSRSPLWSLCLTRAWPSVTLSKQQMPGCIWRLTLNYMASYSTGFSNWKVRVWRENFQTLKEMLEISSESKCIETTRMLTVRA